MGEWFDSTVENHKELFLEISEFIDPKGKKFLDFACGEGAGTVVWSLAGGG